MKKMKKNVKINLNEFDEKQVVYISNEKDFDCFNDRFFDGSLDDDGIFRRKEKEYKKLIFVINSLDILANHDLYPAIMEYSFEYENDITICFDGYVVSVYDQGDYMELAFNTVKNDNIESRIYMNMGKWKDKCSLKNFDILSNNTIDYEKYDLWLINDKSSWKLSTEVKYEAIMYRLAYPIDLQDEYKEYYVAYITKNVKKMVEYFSTTKDYEMIWQLVENGAINNKNITTILSLLQDNPAIATRLSKDFNKRNNLS